MIRLKNRAHRRAWATSVVAAVAAGALVLSGCEAQNNVVGSMPDPLVFTTYSTTTVRTQIWPA